MTLLSRTKDLLLDFGEVHYMVDSDYRTQAQGWSRADRTGPLDLYLQRSGNALSSYVFRTADYSSDAVAIQAANDAMIDFRGDAILFTPGNYSVATALVIDVSDARWLGPKCSNPVNARSILTAAVANAFAPTAASDRFELGYLQLVPLTAATMWNCAAVTGFHCHDTFWNVDGIAVNIATLGFVFAATPEFVQFDRNYIWVDGAQGPWIQFSGAAKGVSIRDFTIFVEAGSWAAAIDFAGTGDVNWDVGPGYISGVGTALTSLITQANKTTNTTHGFVHGVRASTVGPAAASLAVASGAAAEIDIVDCWRALATDAVYQSWTSASAISWTSGVPYTG